VLLPILFFQQSFLNVGDIDINGIKDAGVAAEAYNYLIAPIKNQKITGVEKGYLTNLINEKFPNLKLDDIKYKFPNKYELDMSEREKKYNIQAANGSFTADKDGFVVSEAQEASPSINFDIIYDKSLKVGEKVQDATLQAALLYSNVNQTIKIENDQVTVELQNGGKVILPKNPTTSKANELYSQLQKIIQKYTIDNRQIDFIDLRFSKPVIKYN
jgi:hypothetical protein